MRYTIFSILGLMMLVMNQVKADQFTLLDLGGATIESDESWITEITEQSQWETFYRDQIIQCEEITVDPAPVDQDACDVIPPAVDFEKNKLYIGGLGAMPSSSYSILISNVDTSEVEQQISVVIMDWGVGLPVINYPIAAVVVPKTDKPAKFVINEAMVTIQDQ
jgi:hypothetical protein